MTERLQALYTRWIEALNNHDLETVIAMHSPNFIDHSGTNLSGTDYIDYARQGFARTWQNLPDYRVEVIQLVVADDKIAFYQTLNGTHSGEMMGVAATHKTVRILESGIVRVDLDAGQFLERWLLLDRFGLMQQIGGSYNPPQS